MYLVHFHDHAAVTAYVWMISLVILIMQSLIVFIIKLLRLKSLIQAPLNVNAMYRKRTPSVGHFYKFHRNLDSGIASRTHSRCAIWRVSCIDGMSVCDIILYNWSLEQNYKAPQKLKSKLIFEPCFSCAQQMALNHFRMTWRPFQRHSILTHQKHDANCLE